METTVLILSLLGAFLAWDLVLFFLHFRYGPAWKQGALTNFYREVDGDQPVQRQAWMAQFWKSVDRAGLSKTQILIYSIILWSVIFLVLYFIMHDLIVAVGAACIVFFYPRYYMSQAVKRRRQLLNDQLADVLMSLVSSLRGGASLEVALQRCPPELERLMVGQLQKPMLYEMEQVVYELKMGAAVDVALRHLQDRVQLEDMDDLVLALLTARERGGNLVEIMERVAEAIRDRIEVRRQVQVLTATKRNEVNILTIAPLVMVLVISLLSPTYLQPLIDHPLGKLAILAAFGMLVGAFVWGRRLAEIEL